jgi:hypothetical protein
MTTFEVVFENSILDVEVRRMTNASVVGNPEMRLICWGTSG